MSIQHDMLMHSMRCTEMDVQEPSSDTPAFHGTIRVPAYSMPLTFVDLFALQEPSGMTVGALYPSCRHCSTTNGQRQTLMCMQKSKNSARAHPLVLAIQASAIRTKRSGVLRVIRRSRPDTDKWQTKGQIIKRS